MRSCWRSSPTRASARWSSRLRVRSHDQYHPRWWIVESTPVLPKIHYVRRPQKRFLARRLAMSSAESTVTQSAGSGLEQRFAAAMMGNYGVPPLALDRGEGSQVWDVDGNRYLDLIAGIAVSALGHAHPAVIAAVTRQVGKIAHTSNLFVHEPGVLLAEKLLSLLHQDARVFFCNSGTEANEAALKVVRRKQGKGRPVMGP